MSSSTTNSIAQIEHDIKSSTDLFSMEVIQNSLNALKSAQNQLDETRQQMTKLNVSDFKDSLEKSSYKVNAGGKIFNISSQILQQYPNSLLFLALTTNKGLVKDAAGIPFLDCDHQVFEAFLQYLNDPTYLSSISYEIVPFIKAEIKKWRIDPPSVNFESHLKLIPQWFSVWKLLKPFMFLFVQNPEQANLSYPLIDIFSSASSSTSTQTNDTKWIAKKLEPSFPIRFAQPHPFIIDKCPISESFDSFKTTFEKNTFNILSKLNWNNVCVAGGAVLQALGSNICKPQVWEDKFKHSDIDLFLYGLKPSEIYTKIYSILEGIRASKPSDRFQFVRSPRALTIINLTRVTPHVQIIFRLYNSISEIVSGFDIDCCCLAYNGTNVFGTPRSKLAIEYGTNMVDPARQSPTYEFRLAHYGRRGFRVLIPGLDPTRIDPKVFLLPLSQTKGLGKLLSLDAYFSKYLAKSIEPSMLDSFLYSPLHRDERIDMMFIAKPRTRFISNVDDFLPVLTTEFEYNTRRFIPHFTHVSSGINLTDLYDNHFRKMSLGLGQSISQTDDLKEMKKCLFDTKTPNGVDVFGPIEWIFTNPGRQHTSSFVPLGYQDWYVYVFPEAEDSIPIQSNTVFNKPLAAAGALGDHESDDSDSDQDSSAK